MTSKLEKLLNSFEIDDASPDNGAWLYYGDIDPKDALKELATMTAELARLRLVESAAKKLLGTNPTRRWVVDEHNVLTLDEMNALDEALKGETK